MCQQKYFFTIRRNLNLSKNSPKKKYFRNPLFIAINYTLNI